METKEEQIITRVRQNFIDKYPNSAKRIEKDDVCFISWIVKETIKELSNLE